MDIRYISTMILATFLLLFVIVGGIICAAVYSLRGNGIPRKTTPTSSQVVPPSDPPGLVPIVPVAPPSTAPTVDDPTLEKLISLIANHRSKRHWLR